MIRFRNASLTELAEVIGWAAEEGWNPGLDDAQVFYAADPDGFFIATEHDKLIAAISVVNHSEDFAFLGLYIVHPEYRGQGVGLGLWQHALEHAGTRTVGLDGVEEQQSNYAASGFVHAGRTTRYTGDIEASRHPDIRTALPADLEQLLEMEAAASGTDKRKYLPAWFSPAPSRTTLVFEASNQIRGLCTIRACRSGAKIGPLIASNSIDAQGLLSHAATLYDGPLTVDVPTASKELSALCQQLNMTAGFHTARMYRGPFQPPQPSFFAVTSLELG